MNWFLLFAAQTILADRATISRIDLSKPHCFTDSFKSTVVAPLSHQALLLVLKIYQWTKVPVFTGLTFQWQRQTINKGPVNKEMASMLEEMCHEREKCRAGSRFEGHPKEDPEIKVRVQ